MSVDPEYDTIDLPANTTIVITQPIEITHSVKIVGNNATLLFDQGDTAAWPSTASGAIYVDAPVYTNIQLTLDDFTIKFAANSPIRWSNPPGTVPALFDPEDNPAGTVRRGHRYQGLNYKPEYHNTHVERNDDSGSPGIRWLILYESPVATREFRRHDPSIRRRAGHRLDPNQRPR